MQSPGVLCEQLSQGDGGYLHGPHDHGAFLHKVPMHPLSVGDDPVGDVADRIKTERPDCHGGVGQGIDSEYVTREPVGREMGG